MFSNGFIFANNLEEHGTVRSSFCAFQESWTGEFTCQYLCQNSNFIQTQNSKLPVSDSKQPQKLNQTNSEIIVFSVSWKPFWVLLVEKMKKIPRNSYTKLKWWGKIGHIVFSCTYHLLLTEIFLFTSHPIPPPRATLQALSHQLRKLY